MATNVEKVQLLIGDTGATQFTVAQIQTFLDISSESVLLAASYALEAWAATLTSGLTSEKIGDYAYTKKDAETKMNLAKKYREEDSMSVSFEIASMDLTYGSAITAEED